MQNVQNCLVHLNMKILKQSKRDKYAELFGTPEHDRVKQAQCAKRAELYGTPEHDRIKTG